ncbi:unnamed protein product [Ceutorhynchus assimilis]|uniref:Uncharacterized protein n=1 Tax=Ceutorhynchus assimilis TaxID=467358 RepID=A0A9N9Q868_9CUCU|nr:unnamed protein product [Ceutorhynchus assimilis]
MTEIVHKMARSMNVQRESDSVCEAYRLGKREDAPLLVKLKRQEEKFSFFKKVKELKGLNIEASGLEGNNNNNNKIFINDDLTLQNQKLFKKAMDFRKLHKFHSVFTRHGKIYLKKFQTGDPTKIQSEEDLKIE